MSYKPLPDCVDIQNSPIHGKGLFATEDIPSGTNLGRSHIKLYTEIIRTPVGGFVNHSDDPNAYKKPIGPNKWNLVTRKDIKAGEEITVKYTFYNVDDD